MNIPVEPTDKWNIVIVDSETDLYDMFTETIDDYSEILHKDTQVKLFQTKDSFKGYCGGSNSIDLLIVNVDMCSEDSIKLLEHIRWHDSKKSHTIIIAVSSLMETKRKIHYHTTYKIDFCFNRANLTYDECINILFLLNQKTHCSAFNNADAKAYVSIINTLSALIETKASPNDKFHTERVGWYSWLLAKEYGMDDDAADVIREAAKLHDIGIVAIPDFISQKNGKLTDIERERMKAHTIIGEQILSGTDESLLNMASTIAASHHERFDGSGYPRSLKEYDIPIEGRIVAIADVFDKITCNKNYDLYLSTANAYNFLVERKGTCFDPELVDCFVNASAKIQDMQETVFPDFKKLTRV